MNYNGAVERTTPHSDAIRLIRFAAVLWLGYLIVLLLFSQSSPSPPHPNRFYYYGALGGIALICLGLAYWRWLQTKLRQFFIPLIVTIVTVLPLLVNHWLGLFSPLGPRFTTPESSILAVFPFLFIGLLLVAWQYKWFYILLVILGITGVNLSIVWSYAPPGTLPFWGWSVVTLIQTVIFLAVGFSISYLMSRLRRQQQSLEEANMRLTHYASTLEQLATTRERNRLARELHDTLAHTLSGLSVQLETIKAYWEVDPKAARTLLDESLTSARSGLKETRRALQALRASPLDDLGLVLALNTIARDAAERANLELELSVAEDIPALSPDVEQGVYRVAQEAIANVVSHAGARKLAVRLEFIGDKLTLGIEDDGAGFAMDKVDKATHFGLTGIEEHARFIGGKLNVISKAGAGTTVRLTV
ncbi:MAG: sensor histidine kinase [Dehalococcoidia bacterium]|jgi:signal transduction histidine kinase